MWEMVKVRSGEEGELLRDGWEPFSISPQDTSYQFYNTSAGRSETQHQSTDYIYLRKVVEQLEEN